MYPVQEQLQVLCTIIQELSKKILARCTHILVPTHLKCPLYGQVAIMALCNEFETFLSQKKSSPGSKVLTLQKPHGLALLWNMQYNVNQVALVNYNLNLWRIYVSLGGKQNLF